jgi:serine/threonine protein kinase
MPFFKLNVLITKSRRACIGDFGLATAKDSKTLVMSHTSATKTGGTLRWQAPELLSPDEAQHSSKASDIYAFACVCYEVRCWQCGCESDL